MRPAIYTVAALLTAATLCTLETTRADTPPEQQAVIRALGGIVSNLQKNRDGTVRFVRFSKQVVSDHHVVQTAAFPQLDYLAVVTPTVGDAGLQRVGELTNLDTLVLSDSGVTDATLALLHPLNKLEHLYLDRTAISDDGLRGLQQLSQLKTLSLNDTKVGDSGLAHLTQLRCLEVLHLSRTAVTDAGLRSLATCAQLRELALDNTSVSGGGLAELKALKQLEWLSLRRTSLAENLPELLAALPGLKQIDLRGASVDETAFGRLQQSLPSLQVFASPSAANARNALQRLFVGEVLRSSGHPAPRLQPEITPVADGAATDAVARILDAEIPPDFQRHVIPLLGRLGCNGRTCHGSFQGKGGFSLSMFGYDFAADLAALTAGEQPRVNTADPSLSLILNKPTSDDEHGGGQRFEHGGWEYQVLLRWITDNAPGVTSQPKKLLKLDVTPSEIVFNRIDDQQQLRCVAVWEDGTREDVTRLTRFQTNDDTIADVSINGMVTCRSPGDTHIIAFYDNSISSIQVIMPVSELTGDRYPTIAAATEVDRHVVAKLSQLGIVPSQICSDAEFLRRVSLDVAGTLPSAAEVTEFLANPSPQKRRHKVDQLLNSEAYATWWGMKLSDLTGSNAQSLGSTDMNSPAADQWSAWLKRRVQDNTGWDRIAAGIILATSRRPGQTWESYAAEQSRHLSKTDGTDFTDPDKPMHYYWFRSNNQTATDRALTFGYTFMGVRLQCAQCHKHPFDQWSKRDFEDFAAFFSRIKTGVAPESRASQTYLKTMLGVPVKLDTAALRRQMYLRVSAEGLPIPWNEVWIESPPGNAQAAKIPGGDEFNLNNFADPREPLVAWLLEKDNPYFAPSFVNRVWAHYFGRGIIDPPDDLNLANPPVNKPLLDWLSAEFITRGYDIQWLHRTITASDAYQRSSLTTATNRTDEHNFSRSLVRRLPAEVTMDAILRATARDDVAQKYLADCSGRKIGQHPKSYQARGIDYSLLVFGKPRRTTSCDCERQDQPTLLQSLFVRNDSEMISWLERPDGWLTHTARKLGQSLSSDTKAEQGTRDAGSEPVFTDEQQTTQLIRTVCLRTLSREPSLEELRVSHEHIASTDSTVEGLRDLMWALLNSPEFLTNH